MEFFKNILSTILGKSTENESVERSKYMPEPETPIDERFIINFKNNGGKFIYCENIEEVYENFVSILQENDWFEKEAITFEKSLENLLITNNIIYGDVTNPVFFLCSCEGLIGNDGSILLSSNQLKYFKPYDLPKNFVVFTTTSNILGTKSDGLRKIQEKYRNNIPTNITTIDCFSEVGSKDYLQYGKEVKNLYLLLLEDL